MAFVAGFSNPVAFTPSGGSLATLQITGWTASEEVQRLLTTHSGSGGITACIAGVYDWTANVTGNLDVAAFLFDTGAGKPGIRPGVKGVMTFAVYTGGTNKFSVGVMITKVNHASPVNGVVNYNFDVGIDWNTASSVTYPS